MSAKTPCGNWALPRAITPSRRSPAIPSRRLSRVLAAGDRCRASTLAGIVTFQLIGVKNISAANALEQYGADLFIKENDKQGLGKEKIGEKIFEIERRLLIKRRT